uniref:DNA ligase (NAD(+)) n=1 Tax=viral metagenome TaxID=1070528 RepID=A0A6C0E139_9ZZZZ
MPETKNTKDNQNKRYNVESFKKMGITVLEYLSEQQLNDMIHYANAMYYNQTPVFTDNEYDIIKEFIEHKYPKNEVVLEVGAPVTKNKVSLPYEMPSMDKIKPDTNALTSWTAKYKGPYVLSCKLDGVSALYTREGPVPKLYTRGNGKIGQDISHLIPFLRLPKKSNNEFTIRGELLISKSDFNTFLKNTFANARNLVSGIVNQKQVDNNIKYVHFVAYEVIYPEMKPSEQMNTLKQLGLETVMYKTVHLLSNEMLSEVLINWRKDYLYEIDGVIVTDDKIYPRKSGNPDYSFAFKMVLSDQIAEAKVVDVIWTPSKDGYLKPRVRIEPIHLGGVTIEYATGFNGAFIEQNKIGVGSLIEIIRSGDVIPYIKSITVPAKEAKMPFVPYKWNDTHVDVLLEDVENDFTVKEKNIAGFFKGLQVDGLSSGNVHRIVEAGFDTIPKIIHMTENDFLKVDGFKEKMAHKIYTGIHDKLEKVSLLELMANSNIFGRGISEKKIAIILEELPTILTCNQTRDQKIKLVSQIKGMANKTAESFVENIPFFKQFIQECGLQNKLAIESKSQGQLQSQMQNTHHLLYKKNIVLTGLRDKDVMGKLKQVAANITSSVSKNTFLVIAKSKEENTVKAEEARQLNIPILTVDEFMSQYFPK